MKSIPKSSITIPLKELNLVTYLKKKLGLKSNVEVVRQALHALNSKVSRAELRTAYKQASAQSRKKLLVELKELDHLSSEGLE